MASFGDWLTGGLARIGQGVNPITAFTTAAPSAGDAIGHNTYDNLSGLRLARDQIPVPAAPTAPGQTYGASAGGAVPAYDPNTDPNLIAQGRSAIGTDTNQLNDLYSAINGALTNYAQSARSNVDTQFGTQQQNNDRSYASNVAQNNAAYGARGAYDSSYRANDAQNMTNAYNASNTDLGSQKNNAYAQIGQTIQGVQGQVADRPQYDLSQYNDVNSLTNLHNQLGQHIASLQATQQKLTPQGELVQKLNSVAPLTSNLDTTLKGQLQNLVNANTPSDAMLPLANGYISRAGITDPNQIKSYTDYLNSLLGNKQQAQNPNLALAGA